jgi:hypothetical protein
VGGGGGFVPISPPPGKILQKLTFTSRKNNIDEVVAVSFILLSTTPAKDRLVGRKIDGELDYGQIER